MIIKPKKFKSYLAKIGMTKFTFAKEIEVHINEIYKLLNGQAVGKSTASKFINYIGAEEVQDLINWKALGVENPL